jgi:hypothetical protein
LRAFLQSIMPAPVLSRRSFTMEGVMLTMCVSVNARAPVERARAAEG